MKIEPMPNKELKDLAERNISTEWGQGLLKLVNSVLDHDPNKPRTTAELSLMLWNAFNAGVDYGKRHRIGGNI